MRNKIVIFDLDNCLSDDRARIPLIDWSKGNPDERYAAYHAKCGDDPAANLHVLEPHISNCMIAFFTARPETVRRETMNWIANVLHAATKAFEFQLYMRSENDRRPSAIVKLDMLRMLRARADVKIVQAYDDREDVVAMYLAENVPADVLKIHDVCAYTNPMPVSAHSRFEPIPVEELGPEQPRKLRAPDLLELAAGTFRERNALYGDNYRRFGAAFLALFPGGRLPPIEDVGTMDRVQLMMQILNKLTRYAENVHRGGHQDSARDMTVYSAMLEEMTK